MNGLNSGAETRTAGGQAFLRKINSPGPNQDTWCRMKALRDCQGSPGTPGLSLQSCSSPRAAQCCLLLLFLSAPCSESVTNMLLMITINTFDEESDFI